MFTTPNMGLKAWDQDNDPYSNTDLANNMVAIDNHDHSPGKGAPLTLDSLPTIDKTKLGVCSVGTEQICNEAVTSAKLAQPAVRSENIYPDSINGSHITNNSIGSGELKDRSVTEPKLADDAVGPRTIITNAVTNEKLNDGAVSSTKIAPGAVVTSKIADFNVTTSKYANQSIIDTKIAPEAVTKPKIAKDAVGIRELRRVPCVYLSLNKAHSIPSNNFHRLLWDENRYDTDDMWHVDNRGFIRIRTRGLYLIEACVLWDDGSANQRVGGRRAKIRKGNNPITGAGPLTTLSENPPPDPQAPYRVRLPMVAVISCNVGDRLDVIVEQTSGSTQRILPDGLNSHFSATWLAPHPGQGNNKIPDTL